MFTFLKKLSRKSSGFTLIELLVVVSIIGVLASVVLASLNSARAKADNAVIRQNLTSIRNEAEILSNGSTYVGTCANAKVVQWIADNDAKAGAGSSTCSSSVNSWAAASKLKVAEGTIQYWCLDSTGVNRGVNSSGTPYASLMGSTTPALNAGSSAPAPNCY